MIDPSLAARRRATAAGAVAVLLWASLALLTAASGRVPPFQLAAMSFAIGGAVGLAAIAARDREGRRRGFAAWRQPWPVWALGVAGLFGYHFAYFTALRNAPPVEAGLIAYLWPLLIVLLSALLPGERLGWHHVAGALAGFAGAALIVTGGDGVSLRAEHGFGYAMAFVCAFVWSGYSVLSRRFGAVPTDVVAGYCLATAVLAALAHLALEETVWPASIGQWLAVAGLGLGPVGAAFYVWDHGVKRGDIQVLGALSYLAPLLSTLALVAAGLARADATVGIACALITAGAALAAKDLLARPGAARERR